MSDQKKYEQMDAYRLTFDDLPDGAFFQAAEDLHGWTADDWAWFVEQHEKHKAAAPATKGGGEWANMKQ